MLEFSFSVKTKENIDLHQLLGTSILSQNKRKEKNVLLKAFLHSNLKYIPHIARALY